MDSKELNSFLFVQHPQIGSPYVTEGKMILKYQEPENIDLKANSWVKSDYVWSDWVC